MKITINTKLLNIIMPIARDKKLNPAQVIELLITTHPEITKTLLKN